MLADLMICQCKARTSSTIATPSLCGLPVIGWELLSHEPAAAAHRISTGAGKVIIEVDQGDLRGWIFVAAVHTGSYSPFLARPSPRRVFRQCQPLEETHWVPGSAWREVSKCFLCLRLPGCLVPIWPIPLTTCSIGGTV